MGTRQAFRARPDAAPFLGDVAVARADTLRGIQLYDRVRHRQHKRLYGGHDPGVCAHNFGSNAAWATGHAQEALALARDSIALAQKSSVGWDRSEVQRLQAELMLQLGQLAADDAIARIEHAAWIANGQGAVVLEWRAMIVAARLLAQQGDLAKAREHLQAVCGASTERLDALELTEARDLLAALG